jgi:putative ABC transport system permease protein
MDLRDLRVGWRILIKEPGYSIICILGLALAFAACLTLVSYAYIQFHYDAQVPNNDRVFQVKGLPNYQDSPRWTQYPALGLRDAALNSGLDIIATVVERDIVRIRTGNLPHQYLLRAADPSFAAIFGIRPMEGDLTAALSRPNGLAVTRQTALQLFGDAHVVGRIVDIEDAAKPNDSGSRQTSQYEIMAVLGDPPANSTLPFSILASTQSGLSSPKDFEDWAGGHGRVYVKFMGTPQPDALRRALQSAMDHSPAKSQITAEQREKLGGSSAVTVGVTALRDVHFDPDFAYAIGSLRDDDRYGNPSTVLALAGMGLLILLLATINYVNLATVRTIERQHEIAIRKLIGTPASRIASQFIIESLLVTVLATTFGIVLTWLGKPLIEDLFSKYHPYTSFSDINSRPNVVLLSPATIGFSLAFGIMVGLASGIYPALIAARTRVARSLAGRGDKGGRYGHWWRRALTVLQIASAMALAGVALAVTWQSTYATRLNLGFNQNPLIVVTPPFKADPASIRGFETAAEHLDGVFGVTSQSFRPASDVGMETKSVRRLDGLMVAVENVGVAPNAFQIYGVTAIAGRVFDNSLDRIEGSDAAVLDRAAVRAIGFRSPDSAVGAVVTGRNSDGSSFTWRIVGVIDGMRLESIYNRSSPMVYLVSPASGLLTIRARGNVVVRREALEKLWPQYFPNAIPHIELVKSNIEGVYADDRKEAQLIAIAASLAMAIAAVGIYVLSAYTVRKRTKEIVLRKLYGATPRDIVTVIAREFALLNLAGAILGLPIAAICIQRYLGHFVEQAPGLGWALPSAVVASSIVVFVCIVQQLVVAMRTAPIQVLRN